MKKYSFKSTEPITYTLDFTDGFALNVLVGDARKSQTKRFEFRTACGLANAEIALCDENPQSRTNGYWCDDRRESLARYAAYIRAYNRATDALPF